MIRVLKGIRSLREPAALRGWVRRIAVREAIKLAQARRDPLLLDRLPERAAGDAAEVGADIADVLRRLTPEQRAILVLRGRGGHPAGGRARHGQVAAAPSPPGVSPEVVGMTQWPTARLDPVRQMLVLARVLPAVGVVERVLDAPYGRVWSV